MKLKDPSLLQTRCLIDGQWLDADSGKTIAVTNPATGETWTGRGKPPKWIQDKNRDDYLIK